MIGDLNHNLARRAPEGADQDLALTAVGVMSWRLVALSIAALAPLMAGVWLGQYLGGRVGPRTFERLTLAVLMMIALGLLAQALPDILA